MRTTCFAPRPNLHARLAQRGHFNVPSKSLAFIENNSETLTEQDVELLLDDAYVPRKYFRNPGLLTWFNETDAWWFDNVRANADKLESPYKRALALAVGMSVGDYVFSFNLDTRDMRQPLALSNVYRRLLKTMLPPIDNRRHNTSSNKSAKAFLADNPENDLMFLRLPHSTRSSDSRSASTASKIMPEATPTASMCISAIMVATASACAISVSCRSPRVSPHAV